MSDRKANQELPPELIDNIIYFCSDDKETLFSLALICKSWLPLVQSRLFDRICIQPPSHNKRCDEFLNNSTIVGYIQHVALNFFYFEILDGNEEDEVKYFLGVVEQIRKSNVLKSLSIWLDHRPNFTPCQQLLEFLPSGSFTNIIELNISISYWNLQKIPIADIIHFICAFPHLQALYAQFSDLGTPSNSSNTDLTPVTKYILPTSLRTFHIWVPLMSKASTYLGKWLSSQPPRGVLDLSILMTPSLKFQSYTVSCSRNLRALTFFLYPEFQLPGSYDYDLSSFPVLESLSFIRPCQYHHFPIIRRILETVKSARIRRFRLINVSASDKIFREQLGTLDDILATERFKDLVVEIHFVNIFYKDLGPREQEVRNQLQRCFMEGRLEVLGQEIGFRGALWRVVWRYWDRKRRY